MAPIPCGSPTEIDAVSAGETGVSNRKTVSKELCDIQTGVTSDVTMSMSVMDDASVHCDNEANEEERHRRTD